MRFFCLLTDASRCCRHDVAVAASSAGAEDSKDKSARKASKRDKSSKKKSKAPKAKGSKRDDDKDRKRKRSLPNNLSLLLSSNSLLKRKHVQTYVSPAKDVCGVLKDPAARAANLPSTSLQTAAALKPWMLRRL